jgi:hypothetical protein
VSNRSPDSNFKQQTHFRALATQFARVTARSFPSANRRSRECRTLGASAAACALVVSTRVSHHGHAENVRHSPRNGFNGFLRDLLGDRLVCHRRRCDAKHHHQLDASSGASEPHDFAVRDLRCSSIAHPRPPHPRPTSVTIAIRPSERAGTAVNKPVIWVRREQEYFFAWGWTGESRKNHLPSFRGALSREPGMTNYLSPLITRQFSHHPAPVRFEAMLPAAIRRWVLATSP